MFVTVASHKGGACKTTTAIHIADYLNTLAPTLLLDADPTQNAIDWSLKGKDGKRLSFDLAPDDRGPKLAARYTHIVTDKGQRPTMADLKMYSEFEEDELLIIPSVPAPGDTDGLMRMLVTLQDLGASRFRVLLTRVPPDATRDAEELRGMLVEMHIPLFKNYIPRLKAFERAAGEGTVARNINDKNAERASAAYFSVGKELLK